MSHRDDLSENAQIILEGLYECGGEANMTEIKQITGLEENKTVLYHTETHLEPSNFVETEILDDGTASGITQFTLTERGRDAVGSLIESTDDPNLVEQVEELREVVSEMKREVDVFAGRMDHFEKQIEEMSESVDVIEEHSEQIEELQSDIQTLESRRESLKSEVSSIEDEVERVDHFQGQIRGVLYSAGILKTTRNKDGSDGYTLGSVGESLKKQRR